jgi:hypothetical protein
MTSTPVSETSSATTPELAAGEPATKVLSPEAQRALAEANARREMEHQSQSETTGPVEIGGRDGPDPVRYGDWETGGIVSDF